MSLADLVNVTITHEPYGSPIDPKDCPEVHNAIGAIRSIDVSRFPMRMAIRIRRVEVIGPTLVSFGIEIVARVVDRDGASTRVGWPSAAAVQFGVGTAWDGFAMGEDQPMIDVVFTYGINMPIDRELPDRMRHWVRDCLRLSVLHELDECMLFDGVRLFDPHAKEGT